MNHLVFLDARAGELEKILSGLKTMLIKEFDPALSTKQPVSPGDTFYFLKDQGECTIRGKATVVRLLSFACHLEEDISHTLKEMQPKLQLTEPQYNYWSAKGRVLLVEFSSAQKIDPVQIDSQKITDQSDWIAFKEFSSMIN